MGLSRNRAGQPKAALRASAPPPKKPRSAAALTRPTALPCNRDGKSARPWRPAPISPCGELIQDSAPPRNRETENRKVGNRQVGQASAKAPRVFAVCIAIGPVGLAFPLGAFFACIPLHDFAYQLGKSSAAPVDTAQGAINSGINCG